MDRKKQPANLDGISFRRRQLTDRQPLMSPGRQRITDQNDLSRPRQSISKSAIDAELNAIPTTREAPKKKGRLTKRKRGLRRFMMFTGLAAFVVVAFLAVNAIIALQKITERNLNGGALALQDNVDPSQLKGEGDGRVNILVIGIGGAGHPGGQLADTIMIVSIDPINNTVAMLSVPRDLYLRVPGHYSMRINEVHATGESSKALKDKGGGPALLAENIERVIGVNIHYFVRVDFQGFIQAVDTVGGIDVKVKEALYDPFIESAFGNGKYGFSIKPGQHHLNGATALQYGRSRKTSSDFARAERQQIVMTALKDKILSLTTLTNPVKITSLMNAAGNHVRTDLSIPDEIMKLIKIAQRINNNDITNFVLDNGADNFLASRNINGASVLVPKAGLDNFSAIQYYVRSQLFVDGFIKKESAQIVILNGTSKAGLAAKAATYLKGYGYNVVKTGEAPSKDFATTMLYDQSGGQKPFTLKLLEKRLSTGAMSQSPAGVTESADIIIILGDNFTLK